MNNKIEWEIDVSILNNRFILKELLKVLSISVSITVFIVFLISLPSIISGSFTPNSSSLRDGKYALILIGAWIILTIIFILSYYGNKYSLRYNLISSEVRLLTCDKQRRKNMIINMLLIFAGLIRGTPSYIGTGLINANNQNMSMKFKSMSKAIFYNKFSTVTLRAGYGVKMIVFCTQDNYPNVISFIKEHLPKKCRIEDKI